MALANDFIDIRDESQGSLAISTSATQSGVVATSGIYDLASDVDCYIKIAITANDVTTSTGYLLYAGNTVAFRIDANFRVGAITPSGSGTLRWHKVGLL